MSTHDSDTAALYALLCERGPEGVHTSEIRRRGLSGNPSQRCTDAEHRYGCQITREVEWWTDAAGKRRNGSRFTLTPTAPAVASATSPGTVLPSGAGDQGGDPSTLFDLAPIDIPKRPSYMDAA